MIEPKQRRIDVGAVSLGCLEYGNPDHPPVVIFHGLSDSAWSLDLLAQSLATEFHVFNFDLRGHGLSDWGPYTLLHLVGDISGAVEALDLVAPIVIGHSLGGQAASQFCGLYPELPRALVVIEALGPPPNRLARQDPDAYQRSYSRHLTDLVRRPARNKPHPDLAAATERFQRAHPMLDPGRAAFLVEKNTKELADGSREWRFDPETRDWLAGHDHQRAEERWRGVTCPTLVVLGNEAWERFWEPNMIMSADLEGPMSAAELERRLANFANVSYVGIEDAGHMVHYDQPEKLHHVVRQFLARQNLPAAL